MYAAPALDKLREMPIPEQQACGPQIVTSLPKGRMMPLEMQQIALHPSTDPESHFHQRSIAYRRPRANFDAMSDDGSQRTPPTQSATTTIRGSLVL